MSCWKGENELLEDECRTDRQRRGRFCGAKRRRSGWACTAARVFDAIWNRVVEHTIGYVVSAYLDFTPGSFGAVREDGPNVVYKLSRGIARCYGLRAAIVNDGAV
jgi:hypothetical protein